LFEGSAIASWMVADVDLAARGLSSSTPQRRVKPFSPGPYYTIDQDL
jgi:hypothetical protein